MNGLLALAFGAGMLAPVNPCGFAMLPAFLAYATGADLRHVESLREHYAPTLRAWVANLEHSWEKAVAEVGAARARVWRLYMAASALGFETGHIQIHQVLAVPSGPGTSSLPALPDWEVSGGT